MGAVNREQETTAVRGTIATARLLRAGLAIFIGSVLAACSTTGRAPAVAGPEAIAAPDRDAPSLADPRPRISSGRSVEGRPIVHHVVGTGPDTVLVLASIHGNESAGTPLVDRLHEELLARPALCRGRTVVLLPNANPDGVERRHRRNANGVDLNRNFPASIRGHGPHAGRADDLEPETRSIIDLVERYRPAAIVSIHQPLGCIDYDGPARPLAEAMARSGDLPVRRLGARPGSLGSWAGVDRGIAVITLELPGAASRSSREALWDEYGPMLLRAVR